MFIFLKGFDRQTNCPIPENHRVLNVENTQLSYNLIVMARQQLDVLLPFHRVDQFLFEAIRSVQNSVGININLILVDDRVDKSTNLSWLENSNTKLVINHQDHGYGNALKAGTQFLSANHVGLMNSDDTVSPTKFMKQLQSIKGNDLVITGIQRINQSGRVIPSLMGGLGDVYHPIFLALGAYGADATWLVRSDVWKKFHLENVLCLDWRIAHKTFHDLKIVYLPEALYSYRKHKAQPNYSLMSDAEIKEIYSSWSIFLSNYGMQNFDITTFCFLAAPWLRMRIEGLDSVESQISQMREFVENLPLEVQNTFYSLIKRRYSLSINLNASRVGSLPFLIFRSNSDLISLVRDFLVQRFKLFGKFI
jgi:glycosyltransferase involved in cell wall biosynthesis